jgi:hypothetical protein
MTRGAASLSRTSLCLRRRRTRIALAVRCCCPWSSQAAVRLRLWLVADGCRVDECDVGGASTVADVSVGECDDVCVFRTIKYRQRRLDRVLTAPSDLDSIPASDDLAGTSPSPRDALSSMSHARGSLYVLWWRCS